MDPNLSYKFDLSKESDYILIIVTGKRSLETLISLIKDLSGTYKDFGDVKVLMDLSSFGEPMKMLDSWKFFYGYLRKSKIGFKKCSVIENKKSIKLARFYEKAAQTIGFNLGVYSNVEEGKKWLLN